MAHTRPVHVEHSEIIDAPVEDVWSLVSDFNNVASWHPDVTDSRIEAGSGKEAGTIRAIHLRDGTPLREELLAISRNDHSYTYSIIESPLPLRNHRSTVRLEPLAHSRTRVTWTAEFDAVDVDPDTLASGVESAVMTAGISGLRGNATARDG
jgi:carbon monoxide dehydrogenase subunit G